MFKRLNAKTAYHKHVFIREVITHHKAQVNSKHNLQVPQRLHIQHMHTKFCCKKPVLSQQNVVCRCSANICHFRSLNSRQKPLSRRSIHDDVDPENLHCIQWIRKLHYGGESDECQRCYTPDNTSYTHTISMPFS